MTAWEWRDVLADSVIPVQLLLVLGYSLHDWRHGLRRRAVRCGLLLAAGVLAVYGWQAVDVRSGLWLRAGWDYSTHTAAAAVLTGLLILQRPQQWAGWLLLGIAYAALMLWQQYHGLADIVSTLLVIGASLAVPWWLALRDTPSGSADEGCLRRPQ